VCSSDLPADTTRAEAGGEAEQHVAPVGVERAPTRAEQSAAAGLGLRGGPLLNFGIRSVPDWMYIWEHDFEAIYDAAREHGNRALQSARQLSNRQFGGYISA
jgi:hypothetical protein